MTQMPTYPPFKDLTGAQHRPEKSEKNSLTILELMVKTGFVRVLENLESPGILLWHFPGLESPGKGYWSWKVLEICLTRVKNMKCVADSKEN